MKMTARLELLEPQRIPKNVVTYREAGPGTIDPVQNAENQLMFLQDDFLEWLEGDFSNLRDSWNSLRQAPDDQEKFLVFHKAVHIVAGNAAILNCPTGSKLARPLARMLERRPNIECHLGLIDSAIHAINAAIRDPESATGSSMDEIVTGLNTIVARWIEQRH